jgi:hypothetical protein
MGAHVDYQRTVRPARLSALVTAMLVLHILALKLLSLPSDRSLRARMWRISIAVTNTHSCGWMWDHKRSQNYKGEIAHVISITDFNFARTTRICVVKIRKLFYYTINLLFYHTLDTFTTQWTSLPHIGHFYHTVDIFTTHWTFLPHVITVKHQKTVV